MKTSPFSCFIAIGHLFLATAGHTSANLIVNGDFETGTFAGWTTTPAPVGSFFGVGPVPLAHDTLGAFFAATGPDFDSISQTFVTTPGAFYDLSFFYQVVEPGSPPDNGFRVLFNGVLVFENLNAISGFGTFTFTQLQATGSTTTVEFQGRNVRNADFLDDVTVISESPPASCVRGQGYWKNHPAQWPVIQLLLGNNAYDNEQLRSILHEAVRGNGLVLLAHQLIAAKLNIVNGADASCIEQTLADADALIGDLLVPPVGDGYLRPEDVSALADTLDDYNEGALCAQSCDHQSAAPRARPVPHSRP
jgi:hypothetical protein